MNASLTTRRFLREVLPLCRSISSRAALMNCTGRTATKSMSSISMHQNLRNFHVTCRMQLPLDDATRQKIDKCVKSAPVVVFMKGTQQEPMCGFSRNVKLVLDLHHVPFQDFNVLEDEQLRQGVKEFSDWPTIPQVYVNGKFVGGSDIIVQMHKDGEIVQFFDQEGIPSRFSEKFNKSGTKEGNKEE